jgi:hypothetical protein
VRAIVVYESMYGNTHAVADAIGVGLAEALEVEVVSVHDATNAVLDGAVLLVVGGPTHAHSMSRTATRASAVEDAAKAEKHLELDPDAYGDGLREWFASIDRIGGKAAAFDTRVDIPPALSGRASKAIAKHLRQEGCTLVADPESFLVTRDTHLEPQEAERAVAWGAQLAAAVTG